MDKNMLRLQLLEKDLDRSGYLASEELLAAIPKNLWEKAQEILQGLDRNSEGKISYEEFLWFYEGVIESNAEEDMDFLFADTLLAQRSVTHHHDIHSEDAFDDFDKD